MFASVSPPVGNNERMQPSIDIRQALPTDVDSVQRCVIDAYEGYVERIGRPPAPMLDDYRRLIGDGTVHLAVRDGQLHGVIVAWARPDHFYIDNIATTSTARGSGVGRQLMDWAEDRARSGDFGEVRLYTNTAMLGNVSYYERRGFVETHRSDESGYERIYFTKEVRPLQNARCSEPRPVLLILTFRTRTVLENVWAAWWC